MNCIYLRNDRFYYVAIYPNIASKSVMEDKNETAYLGDRKINRKSCRKMDKTR